MRRVNATDVAAALALATFMVAISLAVRTTQPHARGMTVAGATLLAAAGLAVAWWRAAPMVSYAVALTAAVAYLALRYPGWPVYVGAIATLVALVSTVEDRRWVLPAAAGGVAVAFATGPPEGWNPVRMTVVAISWAIAAILADRLARGRRRLARTEAARLVAEERLRIARELHDVLSHSLAAVTLQAGVGLHVQDNRQAARDALVAIRQISNDALAQARTALATPCLPSAAFPRPARSGRPGEAERRRELRSRHPTAGARGGPRAPVPSRCDATTRATGRRYPDRRPVVAVGFDSCAERAGLARKIAAIVAAPCQRRRRRSCAPRLGAVRSSVGLVTHQGRGSGGRHGGEHRNGDSCRGMLLGDAGPDPQAARRAQHPGGLFGR